MKTTVAFFIGDVKPEHKYLQTYLFKDGYAVEEKGVSFDDIGTVKANQTKRFAKDESLLRIDIYEPGCNPVTIVRQ